MLSVVVPTNRNISCELLEKSVHSLEQIEGVELIFVDLNEAHSRAERLNIGFHRTKGDFVLFHHPRSFIDSFGIQYLLELCNGHSDQKMWGGFRHCFDKDHPVLQFTSWYSNNIRARLHGILYLDHCIFFSRNLWRRDLPKVDIFEDTILSKDFSSQLSPTLLPFYSVTSAIRFEKNGIMKQSILNQTLKIAFHLDFSDRLMNKVYERGLFLNCTYSSVIKYEN